jgi:TfoX/Sxy family transcriptional regulator of competence genes
VAVDAKLAARVRALFADRTDVEEKRMVGGLSFLVGGHLCVGVSGDALLVRVGPDRYEATLDEPGVRPLTMGRKHPVGYVLVAGDANRTDDEVRAWVERGLAFVATLPPRARAEGQVAG